MLCNFVAFHKIIFHDESNTETEEHKIVYAYVLWKKLHPQSAFFGVSSTVSTDLFEESAACCFLPVQRIACLAAHALIPVDFGSIKESVFVSSPIPIKYYL